MGNRPFLLDIHGWKRNYRPVLGQDTKMASREKLCDWHTMLELRKAFVSVANEGIDTIWRRGSYMGHCGILEKTFEGYC